MRDVLDGTEHAEVKTAVYVVTDEQRIVRYVGSVDRRAPALRRRLAVHLAERDANTTRAWTRVGLVLVPENLAHRHVLLCEGWCVAGKSRLAAVPLDGHRQRGPSSADTCSRPRAASPPCRRGLFRMWHRCDVLAGRTSSPEGQVSGMVAGLAALAVGLGGARL